MNKRQIKFRVWLIHWKKMLYPEGVHYFWSDCSMDFCDEEYHYDLMEGDYMPQQFTGLYDKNGKEIWEGDVVSLNEEGTYLVTWDEEDCLFKFGNSPVFEACAYKAKIMVIGNIYEHPELVGDGE